jgi:hypothetical protein
MRHSRWHFCSARATFTYDGKQHAVIGVPDYDTIGGLKRVESKDGKTLTVTVTVTVKLTTAKGELENDVAVYDKQ